MFTFLILAAITTLICAGVLARTLVAFTRVTPSRASALLAVEQDSESELNDERIRTLQKFAEKPVNVLAPLLLATLTCQIATVLFAFYAGQIIWGIRGQWLFGAVAFIALTALTLLNSATAILAADSTAVRLVPVLKALRPLRFLTAPMVAGLAKRTPAPALAPHVDEQQLLAIADKADAIGSGEVTMLRRLIEFDDTTVGDIMSHRSDLVALRSGFAVDDALEVAMFNGLSRLPVVSSYDEIGDVIGGIHIKTLIFAHLVGKGSDDIDLWMSDIPTVPENQQIENLLEDLRSKEFHLAAVIDEHGDLAGVVTLEDVLEELVGEIKDEFDRDAIEIVEVSENVFEIDGRIEVDRLAEELHCEMGATTARTVAGMIFSELGRVPEVGETFKPENGDVELTVTVMNGRRIRKIKVQRIESEDSIEDTSVLTSDTDPNQDEQVVETPDSNGEIKPQDGAVATVTSDRNHTLTRAEAKSSNSPMTKQQTDISSEVSDSDVGNK